MKQTTTVLYGFNAVKELLAHRLNEIDRLYFESNPKSKRTFFLLKEGRRNKIPCQCVPIQKLDQIADSTKHQGVVALCSIKPYDTIDSVIHRINASDRTPIILVPASLEDPRNLGAIVRSSVAFGVTALLLERKQTAPLTATVAKTSAGMLEHMPIVKPQSLEKEIKNFIEKGFSVLGVCGNQEKKPEDVDFTKPCVIITGGEYKGIPPYLQKLCTDFVGIPIAQPVESLNVSVAASIILYEIAKQRHFDFS